MMSSKNNRFTASDIERYHSGKMMPEERHALEKAALDDPFLADAIEGYTFTSTPSADLAKIRSRLNAKADRKKVIPIFQKYKWLSVAALFIIIAGTGWLVYDLSKKGAQPSVAVQKEKKPVESSNYTMPQQEISVDTNVQSSIPAEKNTKDEQADATTNNNEITTTSNNLVNEQTQENLVVSNSRNNQSNAYNPNNEGNTNSERRFSVPQEQVGGNNGRANNVQRVEIQNNRAPVIVRENDIASNQVSRNDVLYKEVNANKSVARVRRVDQNDSVKHFDIVLQPLPKDSQPVMQEVVVGYGVERKTKDKYPKVTIDTLEPAEGYVKFDDYVINNLKMPEELRTKTLAGEVQLSFDVDQNGQPTNITVVKSLCEKCDEEAVRLLKEGPKWKKKKNKKGKITIKF